VATLSARFWGKVRRAGPEECWLWTAATNKDGYGIIVVAGRCLLATRVAHELTKGPIPAGLMICHTCDNPQCVNPKHIYAGTAKDNAKDCMDRGRKASVAGERNPRARLTSDDVDRMRMLRQQDRLSVEELAGMFKVTAGHVSRILRGTKW